MKAATISHDPHRHPDHHLDRHSDRHQEDFTPALAGGRGAAHQRLLTADAARALDPELAALDDADLGVASSIALRHKMKHSALIVAECRRWWATAHRIAGMNGIVLMPRAELFRVLCLLYSSLVRELDIAAVAKMAAHDADTELGGAESSGGGGGGGGGARPGMTWSAFHTFMYELVDNWTESFSALEYASFLRKLYADVTVRGAGSSVSASASTSSLAAAAASANSASVAPSANAGRRFLSLAEHFEQKRVDRLAVTRRRERAARLVSAGHYHVLYQQLAGRAEAGVQS